MNFRHIEVFFAVMTSGTVTEAARQLGVSQPSVTTTLQQAEAKLGIQLFQRESGRLVPTEEARILFAEAERAHDALEALKTLASRLQIGSGGHVRIAAVPSLSLQLLPDAIARFEKRHTGFQYSVAVLNTEELLKELDSRKGTYNLGFTFGDHADSGLTSSLVGEVQLMVLMPADWVVADSENILSALSERPYISAYDHTALGQACRKLFAAADIEPRIVARSHMHHLAGSLVQRGIGYTVLDALTVRLLQNDRRHAPLIVKPLPGHPTMPVNAVYSGQRGLTNPASVFIECFQQSFAALDGLNKAAVGAEFIVV